MRSLTKIRIIGEILAGITDNAGHYEAVNETDRYFVWAEDTERASLSGSNKKEHQAIQGTIDYFTKQEYDPNVDALQAALNEKEISFMLNSIQYEDETGFIHYEWLWEV